MSGRVWNKHVCASCIDFLSESLSLGSLDNCHVWLKHLIVTAKAENVAANVVVTTFGSSSRSGRAAVACWWSMASASLF
jgi:hypothetical protein